MEAFTRLNSRTLVLTEPNIDTDQIIPARYLVTTDRLGLGEGAFYDWRYHEDGSLKPDSPLNDPDAKSRQVLIAGDNFGCGSSREHAPWALLAFGFRVVISTSFADIFRSNALKNGLLTVKVSPEVLEQLLQDPGEALSVDLERLTISNNRIGQVSFDIEPFARTCMLQGVDQMGFLLKTADKIAAYEAAREKVSV